MAWRKSSEMFRGGKETNGEAMIEGTATWALDDDTVRDLHREGITLAGVWVTNTNDTYVTALSDYFDRSKFFYKNYGPRGGALQRYLPLSCFGKRLGDTIFK